VKVTFLALVLIAIALGVVALEICLFISRPFDAALGVPR
jgi:hypothetical protein